MNLVDLKHCDVLTLCEMVCYQVESRSKQDNLIHVIHMFLHDPIEREHTYARQSIQAFLAGFNKLAKLLREAG